MTQAETNLSLSLDMYYASRHYTARDRWLDEAKYWMDEVAGRPEVTWFGLYLVFFYNFRAMAKHLFNVVKEKWT